MKYLPTLAAVCLLIGPSVASAQQISPNPNPAGNLLTVDTSSAFNNVEFGNKGIVHITPDGKLTNEDGATLTNDSRGGNTGTGIANEGTLINTGTLTNTGVLSNHNTLTNNKGGVLTNKHGADLYTGTLTNYGTLTNDSGGKVFTEYGALFNNHGTLANDGKWYNYDGTLTNNAGGTLANNGVLENDRMLNNSGAMTNTGTLTNNNAVPGLGRLAGTLKNTGTLTNKNMLVNYNTLTNAGTLTNSGTLTNGGGVFGASATLTNESGGRLANVGTLTNTKDGTLVNDGALYNEYTLTNNGTIDTSKGTFVNLGTLNGSGHIKGSYTDHGHTKPGNSAGLMTIDGDYFKVAGSKEIELGGLFDYDRIDVTGNVELAGRLDVHLIDGFKLHRGNWFDFMTVGGTLSGQYEGLGQGALVGNFGGQDLFIGYSYSGEFTGVMLYTNAVPEPTTVLIWSMLAGLGMTVRRRR